MVIMKLLFNLALLFVLVILFLTLHSHRHIKKLKWMVFIYFSLSVTASLLLSNHLSPEIRYDLREIPLIIGSLYLPPFYSIILFFLSMFIRAFWGFNMGFWMTLVIYGLQTMAGCFLYKWFKKQTVNKKVVVSMLLSLGSSIGFWVYLFFFFHHMPHMGWVPFTAISAIGTGVIAILIDNAKVHESLMQYAMRSEKMEAISQMSASISHEVRNPLATVKGFLQLLKGTEFDEQKKKEFIDIALNELDRAEKIIRDYLAFSKPSIETFEKVDLSFEMDYILNIIRPMANMNSIEIKTSIEPCLYVQGNRHKFQQSFLNILKNSVEAMPLGGELSIQLHKEKDKAYVHIIDNGVGMTHEQIKHLGEPFFTTKGSQGTGLGIMASFEMIYSMNGWTHVTSEKNIGTTFIVSFPLLHSAVHAEKK